MAATPEPVPPLATATIPLTLVAIPLKVVAYIVPNVFPLCPISPTPVVPVLVIDARLIVRAAKSPLVSRNTIVSPVLTDVAFELTVNVALSELALPLNPLPLTPAVAT